MLKSKLGSLVVKSLFQTWIFAIIGCTGFTQAQTVTAFDPNPDGAVNVLAVQPDGKLLAGGFFTHLGAQSYQHLARINSDGTPDTGFNDPRVDAVVNALALQNDGKILVGGAFLHLGSGMSYAHRDRLGRLNSDGSLDATFDPPEIFGSYVSAIALQANGQVLVGGSFSAVGAAAVSNLARLNADGSLDTSFGNAGNPAANDVVNALAIQPDGKILVGGAFTQIGSDNPPPPTRNRIARLNADGTLDITFQDVGDTEGDVFAIALQTNGKVVIGGAFDRVNGQSQNFLARLNSDGTSDNSYNHAQTELDVVTLALQPDGKLLAGGSFTTIDNTQSRFSIARFNPNGTLDMTLPNFAANFNANAIAVGPNNNVFVGGGFTSFGGQTRNHLSEIYNDIIFKDNFEGN